MKTTCLIVGHVLGVAQLLHGLLQLLGQQAPQLTHQLLPLCRGQLGGPQQLRGELERDRSHSRAEGAAAAQGRYNFLALQQATKLWLYDIFPKVCEEGEGGGGTQRGNTRHPRA